MICDGSRDRILCNTSFRFLLSIRVVDKQTKTLTVMGDSDYKIDEIDAPLGKRYVISERAKTGLSRPYWRPVRQEKIKEIAEGWLLEYILSKKKA